MKLFFKYLIAKKKIFLVSGLFFIIFAGSFILYHLPLAAVLYPAILCAGIGFVVLIIDFLRFKREHKFLQKIQNITDIMIESFPKTDKIIEQDYQNLINMMKEEHSLYRTKNAGKYSDMVEYYTVWVHQIKTPIASMRLHLQNEDTALSRKLVSDLRRIEQYVEMVLTFIRLNSESTDYVIKEYDLDKLVRQAVRKFSSEFIAKKISLVYEPLNTTVITDEKWLSFVIEQVLSNALKYTPSGSIMISLTKNKTLSIKDTGIGISPEDLPRIFENGYTGYNGRTDRKASGIGLYLCKRICSKLGHKITVNSVLDVGTTVNIDLSQIKLEIE